jgi:hypothetical protein
LGDFTPHGCAKGCHYAAWLIDVRLRLLRDLIDGAG